MTAVPLRLAAGLVRAWTRLYTWRMPSDVRSMRRAEIESDLWEQANASGNANGAFQVVSRLVLGIPHDLAWRVEHASISRAGVAVRFAAGLGALVFVATIGSLMFGWPARAFTSRTVRKNAS